ncbi:Hypp8625 [Branchiostoma lanceolatum]|uniref:Hypp8625 protein n=1 Tax=Branchiostoma lanceolatum TaxID=7740 RepID=A0A8J9Z9H9_BRALA|nr:Hypp8625 [Branchiostoma lanceolatum]
MADPGTADDEYEMIDTQDSRPPARSTQQDSRPPARSPQAPATVPPPPGVLVSGTESDSLTTGRWTRGPCVTLTVNTPA